MVSISVAFEDGLPAFYSHTCRAASHFYYVVIGISVIRTAASDKVVDLGRIADVYFIGNGIACGIIVDPAAAQISHLTAAYRCDIFAAPSVSTRVPPFASYSTFPSIRPPAAFV